MNEKTSVEISKYPLFEAILLDIRGNALKTLADLTELKLDVESQLTISGVKKLSVDISLSLLWRRVSLIL